MIISGISLLFEKVDSKMISNVVRCYIDDYVEGQDEYFYKANAERHFKDDPLLVDHKIVAWHHILTEDVDG